MYLSFLNLGLFFRLFFCFLCIVFLSCFRLVASTVNGNETDKQALLEFKARITNDPLGVMSSWNDRTHFCHWYGITCSRRHQRVTILNLQSLQLGGSISPYIGNLSFLRYLYLQHNSFRYEIPQKLGHLRRLEKLLLSNNSFTGNIPSNISSCSKLSEIYIAYNELEGEIPEELGTLSKLQILSMQKNYLSGNIPSSLGNLSSLQVFSAPENHLHGSIPGTLSQLKNLTFFSLAVNSLSGIIPLPIYNLSSIIIFNVAHNIIGGRLPSNLGITLPNLQTFVIAENEFIGSIPSSFSNISDIQRLILSENKFTGSVPSTERLHKLEILGLGYNYLGSSGVNDLNFLSSLVNSTNLWLLEIDNNKFEGVLPDSISNFSTTLARLSISDNAISGRIPNGIVNLFKLERVQMWNNQLSGNIPIDIGKMYNLKILSLDSNRLSGNIPSSLGNLTLLFELRLYHNYFQGNLPASLGECQNLMLLDLSDNNLSGTIPPQVIGISSLSIFMDLSANYFTGGIPMEVGNLKDLGELGISDNMLSGKIPDSLGDCKKLEVLALQGNFFYGSIPSSLRSLRGLRELDVSRNNLSGEIPDFLQGFDLLESLNLSYNNFEGMVPVGGIFKNASATLLMGNDKLCGGIPEFHLPFCNVKHPTKRLSLPLKIVISIVGVLSGLAFALIFIWLRKKKKEPTLDLYGSNVSYQILLKATNGFSSANIIGAGSFGCVYKGIVDKGKVSIAAKMLNLLHHQASNSFVPKHENEGEMIVAIKVLNLLQHGASNSFIAECEALKNIRHRNLVKVLTVCSSVDYHGNDFKALVYEYMANGSLEAWLHPISKTEQVDYEPPKSLNLLQRLNIAIDVASALDYLHNQCTTPIVHCDLKPSNILLDAEMNGHVGDFGLAKILSENTRQSSSSQVRGTIGYAPPEYGTGSEVSTHGDVYSYGIVLLELLTAKRPTDNMFKEGLSLNNLAKIAFSNQAAEIADPILLQEISQDCRIEECLFCMFQIGVSCSADVPQERMKINCVVAELHSIREKLARARLN